MRGTEGLIKVWLATSKAVLVIGTKNVYKLPHELPNDWKLKILENKNKLDNWEITEKSQNW